MKPKSEIAEIALLGIMDLTSYGTAFNPNYLGNWVRKVLNECGIHKRGACDFFRSCPMGWQRIIPPFDFYRKGAQQGWGRSRGLRKNIS